MTKLIDYALDVYSQNGEDGIIAKIFEIISKNEKKNTSKTCIEFGAWDGFYLSNTANLWGNKAGGGWEGILIEADREKYQQLVRNVKDYNCVCINEYVSYPASNTLEKILDSHNIKDDIDLLSIDIDGDDYYVFKSLRKLKPKVICCEYNPTIPMNISVFGERGSRWGCSVMALVRLAKKKGYSLVALTDTNCIFIKNEFSNLFNMYETNIRKLQKDYIFRKKSFMTNYDGKAIALKGNLKSKLAYKFYYGFTGFFDGKLLGYDIDKIQKSRTDKRLLTPIYFVRFFIYKTAKGILKRNV